MENRKIHISKSKTLKLVNVVSIEVKLCEFDNFDHLIPEIIDSLERYMMQMGTKPVGPLVQKISYFVCDNGLLGTKRIFMRQAEAFIPHIEPPYSVSRMINVPNCMYTRFVGEVSNLQHAYSKIKVIAYEDNIKLNRDCYTVFIDNDKDRGIITSDIFIPKIA
ncbi:MAG: hypothetical protein LBN22_00315 [Clostridiales Family XIII bacterium]|nr:hypothetical protein [Clostridiales Family XIII bacterium]